jgi:hypothetical protein
MEDLLVRWSRQDDPIVAPVRCFKRRRTSPESASVSSTIPDPPDDVPVYHRIDDDYSEGSSSPDITEQSRPPQTLDSPMHALALSCGSNDRALR